MIERKTAKTVSVKTAVVLSSKKKTRFYDTKTFSIDDYPMSEVTN
jgi:hypothetical protein